MKWRVKICKVLGSLKIQLLFPVLITTIAIVLVLTVLASRAYTNTILDQEDTKMQSAFLLTGNAISEKMKSVHASTSPLLMNSRIEFYTAGKFKDNLERILARIDVLEETTSVRERQPDIYGVLIMREDGTAFGSLPYRNYFTDNDPLAVLGGRVISDIRHGNTWLGPYSAADFYQFPFSKSMPDQVIVGVNRQQSKLYGNIYALAVVDVKTVADHLDLLADGRSRLYLTTEDGTEIVRSGTQEPLCEETWAAVDMRKSQQSVSVTKKSTGERVYICYQKIDSLGWYLIRELPMAIYDQTVIQLRIYVWYVAGAVFLIALIVFLIWSGSFMKNFESLHNAIDRLRRGQLETRIEKKFRITEFENIRQEFNEMNGALETLMETTRAMERDQLELELRNLQTQLSPHMIFNSITAIRWMATMMGADRVSDMLLELSEMLRPVFRDWKVQWSLGEELDHLEHYAKLLDLRYGNNFVMTIDVPQTMHSMLLPRFTFQPLVENACEHGGISSSTLHVSVRGWIEDGRACFCVTDDGNGIPPERLEEILRKIESGEHVENVGLYSVYSRIRLCVGSDSRMRVQNAEGGGTQVFLDWPTDARCYQIANLPFENK